MNKEQMIEEMRDTLANINETNGIHILGYYPLAEELLKQGYRKETQGEWKKGDMPTYGGYKCSVCGENTIVYKANYCPNCGAKMRGE